MSSCPVVSNAPTASAVENTTPITVSVAILVRRSSSQTNTAPASRAASAPPKGWNPRMSASPIPGRATCDSASPASVMRRIRA
jgi:hypothetical protein